MKKGIMYFIIVFFVWSCGSNNNEQTKEIKEEIKEEVFNPIETYNTFIADNKDSIKEFKDNLDFCKGNINSGNYKINEKGSESESLIIDFLSLFKEEEQGNAVFLRYELIDTLADVKITYRGGDFDYTEGVNFIYENIDTVKVSKMDKFSMEYLIGQRVEKLLKVRYFIIVENVEYEEIVVSDASTYLGGYAKENIYIFDRQKKGFYDVFTFSYRVPDELPYSVVEGGDEKEALASVVYNRFQNGIRSSIVNSFKDNNIIIGAEKDNQFLFNYWK